GRGRIRRPVPIFHARETAPSAAAGGHAKITHRLVAPETLPEPGDGFFETAQVEQARTARAIRPGVCFAEIINARPKKLAGNKVVRLHREPRGVLMAVFAAVNDPLRKLFVVGVI